MIVRIWSTGVDSARVGDYERFALEVSLPMFRAHSGFLGVLFARNGSRCKVITLWETPDSVAGLEGSDLYHSTVDQIVAAGFLRGDQSVEVYQTHGGELSSGIAAALTGR